MLYIFLFSSFDESAEFADPWNLISFGLVIVGSRVSSLTSRMVILNCLLVKVVKLQRSPDRSSSPVSACQNPAASNLSLLGAIYQIRMVRSKSLSCNPSRPSVQDYFLISNVVLIDRSICICPFKYSTMNRVDVIFFYTLLDTSTNHQMSYGSILLKKISLPKVAW